MRVIEVIEGRYETQEVPFGRVYAWHSGSVVFECRCGARPTLTESVTDCGACGLDHAATVRRELSDRQQGDEALRPWRYSRNGEGGGVPY